MKKIISNQSEWSRVAKELEAEDLKLASYDRTLLNLLGDVKGKKLLDYGSGPGVLASALARLGADVRTYDVSGGMRQLSGGKIGSDRVYSTVDEMPHDFFDGVICNLVLCIVDEEEVGLIASKLRDVVSEGGRVYIGFCNPKIFDVPESQLDIRDRTDHRYEENHRYRKTKKEGGYEIVEEHRPLEWYQRTLTESGLVVLKAHFTPEYEWKERKLEDFVIFELGK